MANFKNVPGKGKWDAADQSLTITNGDTAELILWGGGPGGAPLVVAFTNGNLISGLHSKPSPGGNDHAFSFKAVSPGTTTVHARVGSAAGPDYAKPVTIIILPRKAPPIGPEHVIIYSGKGSDNDDAATEGQTKAVAVGGAAYRIDSYSDFFDLLTKYRDSGRKISRLEVNTHGGPGYVTFGAGGKSGLTKAALGMFKGKGFHQVFAPGARVFFHGCNVAEGDAGEEFLKEFGRTFLVGGGGTVAGSTSVGLGTGWIGGGTVYHLWGDVVRVHISNAGEVEKVDRK